MGHVQGGLPAAPGHSDDSSTRRSQQLVFRHPTAYGTPGTEDPLIPRTQSRNKVFILPHGKKVHQANSAPEFSMGAGQVPSHIFHVRPEQTGLSPVELDRTPAGFSQKNIKAATYEKGSVTRLKSQVMEHNLNPGSRKIHVNPSRLDIPVAARPVVVGYHATYVFPNSFNHHGPTMLKKISPKGKKSDSNGHSAGTDGMQISNPRWSPRMYNGDLTPEAKGYTYVRHIRPSFDKTRPQVSSTPGRKFLEACPGCREGQLNSNFNSKGQLSSQYPKQNIVQGKFKPFERHNGHLPSHATAPTQTSPETTLLPALSSMTVTTEPSTKSATTMPTFRAPTPSGDPPVTSGPSFKSATTMLMEDGESSPGPEDSQQTEESEKPAADGFPSQPVTVTPPMPQADEEEDVNV